MAIWFVGSPNQPRWLYRPTVLPSLAAASHIGASVVTAPSSLAASFAASGSGPVPMVTQSCGLSLWRARQSSTALASSLSAAGNHQAVSSMSRFRRAATSASKVGTCSERQS